MGTDQAQSRGDTSIRYNFLTSPAKGALHLLLIPRLPSALLGLAIGSVFLLLGGCLEPPQSRPYAQQGQLDLRAWNFAEQGAVPLSGEWDFYWQQLLQPGEPGTEPMTSTGIWDQLQAQDGAPLGAIGYGTFRLRVLLPPIDNLPELALRVRGLMTAHRLWLGAEEVRGAGVVDADLSQTVAATPNRIHVVRVDSDTLLINLQVANPEFRMGGIRKPLQLGAADDLLTFHTYQVIYDAVIFTLLFATGLYFLLIFAARPKEMYRFYFGLLCTITAIRMTVAGEALLIDILLPGVPWAAQIKTEYAANFLGCMLVPGMITSFYQGQSIKPWLSVIYAAALFLMVFALVGPTQLVVHTGIGFQILVANAAALIIVVLLRAERARREYSRALLFTVLLFAIGIFVDILRSKNVFHSPVEIGPALFTALLLANATILARSFTRAFTANEQLTVELGRTNNELRLTNQAVQRFVPYEFLALLHRESIRDVVRGDSTELELEVLFCDLRDFTSIAEHLPTDQTFAFINDWLAHLEPVVNDHQGFVNQYLGDCIMAVFTGGADRAVQAGIELIRANQAFGQEQQLVSEEVRVGVGLNTGPLMLGTIGGRDHLENGVIGDVVNVASRIEAMTKLYDTRFLLTDLTRARLSEPGAFQMRELDRVAVKGKSIPVTVFEVLDVLPKAQREARLRTADTFADGLDAYRSGHFEQALELFSYCQAQDDTDGAAALYTRRCREFSERPPTAWDGVTVLLEK